MFFKKIYQLGDKVEDRVRGKFSHYPIIYAFVGGAGIIIFWRGIWHTMDFVVSFLSSSGNNVSLSFTQLPWWDGPLSVVFGAALLLLIGLFVPSFIGNEIIISGLRGEKKMVEKTEKEVQEDMLIEGKMMIEIQKISSQLDEIKKKIN